LKEEVYNRFKDYSGSHCWQYEVRQDWFRADLERLNMSSSLIASFKPRDFRVEYVDKSDKEGCEAVKQFIEKMILHRIDFTNNHFPNQFVKIVTK